MTILKILSVPNDLLKQTAEKVNWVGNNEVKIMNDMKETMYHENGIGLAATQVGILQRIIVVDISKERDGTKVLMMANPEIIWSDDVNTFSYDEGCLSVPNNFAKITRPKSIKLSYVDEHNEKKELEASDLLSQCIQHEIDHLNGIVFIEYLSKLKKDIIIRKVQKFNAVSVATDLST